MSVHIAMQDHWVCRGPLALPRRGAPAPAAPVGAPRKTLTSSVDISAV